MSELTISAKTVGSFKVISVEGALVLNTLAELGQVVAFHLGKGENRLALNLKGLKDIDSAGIGFLLKTHNKLQTENGSFFLIESSKLVREELEQAGISEVVPTVAGESDLPQKPA